MIFGWEDLGIYKYFRCYNFALYRATQNKFSVPGPAMLQKLTRQPGFILNFIFNFIKN